MKLFLLIVSIFLFGCAAIDAAPIPAVKETVQEPIVAPAALCPDVQIANTRPQYEVHFSPKGGCTESVVAFIGEAKSSVLLQAYGFTSEPIANAMCEAAKKPGVVVEAILDRSNRTDKYSLMSKVVACGVKVVIDAKHQIAHNKILIVDKMSLENGSFNYTQAAERGNAENCLIIRADPGLAAKFEANWQLHKSHSEQN